MIPVHEYDDADQLTDEQVRQLVDEANRLNVLWKRDHPGTCCDMSQRNYRWRAAIHAAAYVVFPQGEN